MEDTRENEGASICDDCDQDSNTCGCDPDECQRIADENSAEEDYEARREMHD